MNACAPLPRMLESPSDVFVRFGPGDRLTGILTGGDATGPTLLLPSAGLQPRSGPFRLHVDLAERLAAVGVRTFRFDMPGVGEAPRLAEWDTRRTTLAAMDCLERTHGCRSFVAGGVCSAADTGWDVAIRDPRVTGVLLLDGLCHAGPWYRFGRVTGLLRRLPREWRHFARKLRTRRQRDGLEVGDFREWPDRAQAQRDIAALVARDVRLLFVYSGAYEECFLHPRQFAWTFGRTARDPRVTMHYWPDCDHVYFGGVGRERLMATIVDWLASPDARSRS